METEKYLYIVCQASLKLEKINLIQLKVLLCFVLFLKALRNPDDVE